MSQPSRNKPCPCGSGRKYKKCCLPPHEQNAQIAPGLSMKDLPPGSRIVERNGQRYLLSAGLDEGAIDIADDHYKRQSEERGSSRGYVAFCQAVINEMEEHDPKSIQQAMDMCSLFWNLALLGDEGSEELREVENGLCKTEEDRQNFRAIAQEMFKRIQQMNPGMEKIQSEAAKPGMFSKILGLVKGGNAT